MKPIIYIAGPLFCVQDRDFLVELRDMARSAGADTFLPHEDNDDNEKNRTPNTSRETLRSIFEKDIKSIDKADAVIALLDGVTVDTGTSVEIGYAYARSKPILGVKTDFRVLGNFESQVVDLMIENACSKILFVANGDKDIIRQGIISFIGEKEWGK